MADPPWPYPEGFAHNIGGGNESHDRALPYEDMGLGDIAALPIRRHADTDCRLFVWTTNRYLPVTFTLLEFWGFIYRQTLVWSKRGGPIGGSVAPNSAEFVLVATRGKPARGTMFKRAVIEAPVGDHSAKPECFQDFIEQVSPGPYLELFACRQRLGWDTWGNEALNHVTL